MAVALIVCTEDPEFWKDKGRLGELLGDRANEIEAIKFHNFGPIDDPVEIEEIEVKEE